MGIQDDADELREQITKKVEGLTELVRVANQVVSYSCLRRIIYPEDLEFSDALSEYAKGVRDKLEAERKRRLESSAGVFLGQLGSGHVDDLFKRFDRQYKDYLGRIEKLRKEYAEQKEHIKRKYKQDVSACLL